MKKKVILWLSRDNTEAGYYDLWAEKPKKANDGMGCYVNGKKSGDSTDSLMGECVEFRRLIERGGFALKRDGIAKITIERQY